MYSLNFGDLIRALRQQQASLNDRLQDPASRDETVHLKRQLDEAIGCLELCERHQIRPDVKVIVVPEPLTRSPSSEFRLIEDHESDHREAWTEVMLGEVPIRPLPGSLIIERR